MDPVLEQDVRKRAAERCEYCQMPQQFYRQRFPIDHIIARQHGGSTALDNLALCCGPCNRYKGPNIAGLDPLTRQLTALFNPRSDRWADHFAWDGPHLRGSTPVGRVTVALLNINALEYVAVRTMLIAEGVFPSD